MRKITPWAAAATVAVALMAMGITSYAQDQQEKTPAPAAAAEPVSAPAEPATPEKSDKPAEASSSASEPSTEPADKPATEPAEKPATAPATAPATKPGEAPAAQAPAVDPQIEYVANAVLADRFAEFAQQAARRGMGDPAALRQTAALLRASTKLFEAQPRYWQLLVEALLQTGDHEQLQGALLGYRKLAPNDQIAQEQLIELYASRIEKEDDALKYLRGLLAREGNAALSPEVRSHVAMMIARRLLEERGDAKGAGAMVDQALKDNPVNMQALDLRYRFVAASNASALERAQAILANLKANPLRPSMLAELGRLLADAGLAKDSMEWMRRALSLYRADAPGASPQFYHDLFVDYAAELYILGDTQAARGNLEQIFKTFPGDPDAEQLQLVIDRGAPDKEAYAKSKQSAGDAIRARWAAAAKQIMEGNAAAPTTQPAAAPTAGEPAPDPAAVAEKVKASDDPALQGEFVSALAPVAWFELYFNERPADAQKPIEALATVLPEDSILLRRLRGWHQMSTRQPEKARETLQGLEEVDALSALALLQIGDAAAGADNKDAKKAGDDQARQLLRNYPSGIVGATLYQAMKNRELKPEPSPLAAAIRQELMKFPKGWADIATKPERFYTVRVDPDHIANKYGEPVYCMLTITNLTTQDIPLGEDGVIQRSLWFDADLQSMQNRRVSGVAIEQIQGTQVLRARSGLQQVIRLDQGALADFLNANPTPRYQITGWCVTNAGRQGAGIGALPGGQKVAFTRKITRVGTTVAKPETIQALYQELDSGPPNSKMRDLTVLATYARLLGAVKPEQQPTAAQQAGELLDHIGALVEDPVPAVAQWAKFELARSVPDPAQRRQIIDNLLADKAWSGRLLGLVAAVATLDAKESKELVAKAAEAEPEAFVKEYAIQSEEMLSRPPTTQPAPPAAAPGEPVSNVPATKEPTPGTAPQPAPAPGAEPDGLPPSPLQLPPAPGPQ
jgi:hypothetical protein